MAATNPDKRRAFAHAYATSGNATAAAKAAGVPDSSAHSMGYKWLKSPDVAAMVREEQDRLLKGLTGKAITILGQMLEDDEAPAQVRLAAAREVLDRAGFAKPKRQDGVGVSSAPKNPSEMNVVELQAIVAADLGIDVGDLDAYLKETSLQ